jgi:CRISPR-associated protein Cas5d
MKYKINFVKVLKPLKFQDVMINGIQDKPTLQAINKGYVASEHRSQRNCLYLLDVEYVIDFDVIALEECIPKTKYVDIATRRIDKGQSFRQPYLGTKECLAYFEWATGEEQPHESFKYITIDMGWLPLKIEHENNLNRDLQQFRIIDGVINYKL